MKKRPMCAITRKRSPSCFPRCGILQKALRDAGWQVDYVPLDDPDNTGSFTGEIARAIDRLECETILVTEPGEWRVREAMTRWQGELSVPVKILEDDRFICSHAEFEDWATGRKQLRMEYFYREMRRKTGLLMEGDEPAGGQWNFDAQNRKPAEANLEMPAPRRSDPDTITQEVLKLVSKRFDNHFGDLERFWFAVTRQITQRLCSTNS